MKNSAFLFIMLAFWGSTLYAAPFPVGGIIGGAFISPGQKISPFAGGEGIIFNDYYSYGGVGVLGKHRGAGYFSLGGGIKKNSIAAYVTIGFGGIKESNAKAGHGILLRLGFKFSVNGDRVGGSLNFGRDYMFAKRKSSGSAKVYDIYTALYMFGK